MKSEITDKLGLFQPSWAGEKDDNEGGTRPYYWVCVAWIGDQEKEIRAWSFSSSSLRSWWKSTITPSPFMSISCPRKIFCRTLHRPIDIGPVVPASVTFPRTTGELRFGGGRVRPPDVLEQFVEPSRKPSMSEFSKRGRLRWMTLSKETMTRRDPEGKGWRRWELYGRKKAYMVSRKLFIREIWKHVFWVA